MTNLVSQLVGALEEADKPPAMTELPEPELGYIETDKSRQPAFSARQMREALQSAQPAAAVSDEAIYAVWTQHCQTPGTTTRQLVCGFARAISALSPAQHAPEWDGGEPANLQAAARDADEWLALIQRLNDAGRLRFSQPDSRPKLDGCRAALSKILCAPAQQAVPMTDEQVDRIWNALPMGNGFWLSFARAVEAHHGITQPAKEQSK